MKRDLFISGLIGLLAGGGIFYAALALSAGLPRLAESTVAVAILFLILLCLALGEIPMMSFGLKQMAGAKTPRVLVVIVFLIYVTFASVYASILVLLTGALVLSLGLAALGIVRFATGAWIG